NRIASVNAAGEHLFEHGAGFLIGQNLADLVAADTPLLSLVGQVRNQGASVAEYDLALSLPRQRTHTVAVEAAPVGERDGWVVLSLRHQTIARRIDRQLVHRNAARSVTGLAAMLAHEVRNPLAGIKGAAQLLHQTASDSDRELTQLICEETDRIVGMVDRVGQFAEDGHFERTPINIHEVLERVRRSAAAGFARGIRIVEAYDPSLPPVLGNRDFLTQAFLNLVKNAAEAAPKSDGEIVLATGYHQGFRIAMPGSGGRVDLPLVVSVQDNGPGIPDALAPNVFDPFVTSKSEGSGLGLALVAKIVADHGGIIEFESEPGRTAFRVHLPVLPPGEATRARGAI
ncbi:MAG: PAS domain-containing protein, partial [Alphaproteobacteria bacterium]|nr:PAS domain-containing protein [Alphaproteobacteria bacterium]